MKFESYKNARIVRSGWLEEGGRRLDCNPYMSGALEARDALINLSARKDPLKTLTIGHNGGIYNGPMFARRWVEDSKFGVPFLGSSDMRNADLSILPLLNRSYAESNRLQHLELRPGTTLITCSGTIGRMAYVRADMAGMWSSQHVMKVVPDHEKIPPGYLHAFLASRFGVPLVVAGTYGAIIQHIEPNHIAELPVPRFEGGFETVVADLIESASTARTLASVKRLGAIHHLEKMIGWSRPIESCKYNFIPNIGLQLRMDAFFHSPKVRLGRGVLSKGNCKRLGDIVESVFEPNRGSRQKVDDEKFGVPFLSSSSVFEVHPVGEYFISKTRTPNFDSFVITSRDVLLPRSGQLGGIIGRAVLPLSGNIGHAGSEHLVRVRCHTEEDAAYLWAVLASEPGYWAVVGTAFGSSIPSLETGLLADLQVPWLGEIDRCHIASIARESVDAQSLGIKYEIEAIRQVEKRIGEGL